VYGVKDVIDFYCGLGEQQWNHHPVAPGRLACVAPVYGRTLATKAVNRVVVPADTWVIQDSGAFSDGPGQRLSVEAALERQLEHAERFGYASRVTHRASYDWLIDEKWEGGKRFKARWTEQDAEEAVGVTIAAAVYLASHRHGGHVILSAQGVSARQYLYCAQQIVPLLEEGDIFALGGWCVVGKYPAQLMPVFRETMRQVIPFLGREGVKRVHIWGVCYARALGELLWLCDEQGIRLSTDSVSPSVRPALGEWGYAEWRNPSYQRPPVGVLGLERARHVEMTPTWLHGFRQTCHYRPIPPGQLSLF